MAPHSKVFVPEAPTEAGRGGRQYTIHNIQYNFLGSIQEATESVRRPLKRAKRAMRKRKQLAQVGD